MAQTVPYLGPLGFLFRQASAPKTHVPFSAGGAVQPWQESDLCQAWGSGDAIVAPQLGAGVLQRRLTVFEFVSEELSALLVQVVEWGTAWETCG